MAEDATIVSYSVIETQRIMGRYKRKRQGQMNDPASKADSIKTFYYFFLLLTPARLKRPTPKSIIVAGSGTGAV